MANHLGNGNNNNGSDAVANNLRDVFNSLQPAALQIDPYVCPYDHIIEMMRDLDLQDDGIQMNNKIKSIATDFCNIVRDENMLWQSMEYINDKALGDGETALKFAMLFSSRNFDALAMNETKVRTTMLTILERNFMEADKMRAHDRNRLYNSITLLGEYYHRVRLADNTPVRIVGESLLELLLREVHGNGDEAAMSVQQAKLLLSQITLNGDMLRVTQSPHLTQLFFHIRRQLIEQPALRASVKALLLMTLDLYYSNFANLGTDLEAMYTKYLVQPEDDDEGNNNTAYQSQVTAAAKPLPQSHSGAYQTLPASPQRQQQAAVYASPPGPSSQHEKPPQTAAHEAGVTYENGSGGDADVASPAVDAVHDDSYEAPKKWSEQVCEESMFEDFVGADSGVVTDAATTNNNTNATTTSSNTTASPVEGGGGFQRRRPHGAYDDDSVYSARRNSRRSQHAGRQSAHKPQPQPQHNHNAHAGRSDDYHNSSAAATGEEERDESKPLPRWRAPRFSREAAVNAGSDGPQQRYGGARQQQRRYSASFDDDGQSVRSEGGSIRLYSISDRLKHSQEKIERSGVAYNNIANSNWDRQSQRDDRSECSYISNYECGNYRRGGRRNHPHHHRQTYDKPPRFQKHHQQQQQQHQDVDSNDKIHSDSWRRSNANAFYAAAAADDAGDANSRGESRARTLPRRKSQWNNGGGGSPTSAATAYRRSQSPQQHQQQQQRPRNFSGARYSSQSSLASETSHTLERRRNQRNNNNNNINNFAPSDTTHGNQNKRWDPQAAALADGPAAEEELVRNARQTTNYMNFLSSQK